MRQSAWTKGDLMKAVMIGTWDTYKECLLQNDF